MKKIVATATAAVILCALIVLCVIFSDFSLTETQKATLKVLVIICAAAAAYCSRKLGWRIVDCARDGQMRSVEEIGEEILRELRQVL